MEIAEIYLLANVRVSQGYRELYQVNNEIIYYNNKTGVSKHFTVNVPRMSLFNYKYKIQTRLYRRRYKNE